jgi:hypothetical protein
MLLSNHTGESDECIQSFNHSGTALRSFNLTSTLLEGVYVKAPASFRTSACKELQSPCI